MTFYNIGEDALPGPVTGTAALPVDPVTAMANNDAARVPVLIGTNHDEFTLFVALQYLRDGKRYTAEDYPRLLRDTFGANAAAVGERYPLEQLRQQCALGLFGCRHRWRVRVCGRTDERRPGRVGSVYAYEFNDRDAPAPESMRTLPFPVGASHSLELRYLFDVGGAEPLDSAQQTLSDQMIDYWSRFVASGSPHAAGQPDWPALERWRRPTQPWMSLQPDGSRVITDFDETTSARSGRICLPRLAPER